MNFRDLLRALRRPPEMLETVDAVDDEVSGPSLSRIALIEARAGGVDLLSDSQTGEIHRIFERGGQPQIDAVPIVRRLLRRDLAARTVAVLPVASEHFFRLSPPEQQIAAHFLGAHFVLDERTRHIYRVFVTPGCCLAERLWGPGLDEVRERPLASALFGWCDLHDEPARAAHAMIVQVVPQSASWGLGFVSLQSEAGSKTARRLFSCAEGSVRHHTRPGVLGTEIVIEIEWQGRIIRLLQEHPKEHPGQDGRRAKSALKVLGEAGEVPF